MSQCSPFVDFYIVNILFGFLGLFAVLFCFYILFAVVYDAVICIREKRKISND